MASMAGKYRNLAKIIIVTSAFGLFASIVLLTDKIHLLENPDAILACDLNPIVSCGSVIGTDQASVFGVPNPLIGVASFSAMLTVGIAMLAGGQFKRWFWQGLEIGTLFGVGFSHWLAYQSIFVIGALCPYCMVVWAAMIPLFVFVTKYNFEQRNIPRFIPARLPVLTPIQLIILWYLLLAGMILIQFWYYWQTVVPFSWLVS